MGTIPHENMGCYVYFIKHKNDMYASAALIMLKTGLVYVIATDWHGV